MYFLVYGDDSYRSRKKLTALRDHFKKTRDSSGMNERVLRASENKIEEALEALFASPFLAEKKIVVLQGFLSGSKDMQEKLAEVIPKKPDSTIAIFYEESDAKSLSKSPLFAVLKDQKFTEEFPAVAGAAVNQFVANVCAEEGQQIEIRAMQTLVSMVGTESWTLRTECMKLCAYASATEATMVTLAMVEDMVTGERDESVFAFLDCATQGKSAQAITQLETLIETGTAELQLVSMLSKQIRTMLGAKDLGERGVHDKNEVARALGVHPFPASKAMAASRNMETAKLIDLHAELIEVEHLLKTGGTRPRVSLGLFATHAAKK